MLYLVEIKRFGSSKAANGRNESALSTVVLGKWVESGKAFNVKAYIAGFIDAEGNFFIKVVKSSTLSLPLLYTLNGIVYLLFIIIIVILILWVI